MCLVPPTCHSGGMGAPQDPSLHGEVAASRHMPGPLLPGAVVGLLGEWRGYGQGMGLPWWAFIEAAGPQQGVAVGTVQLPGACVPARALSAYLTDLSRQHCGGMIPSTIPVKETDSRNQAAASKSLWVFIPLASVD